MYSKSEIENPTDSQMKSEGYDSGYALNYDNSLNSERDYNNRKGEGNRFYDGEKRIVRIQSHMLPTKSILHLEQFRTNRKSLAQLF